jgi:hypothetical protein
MESQLPVGKIFPIYGKDASGKKTLLGEFGLKKGQKYRWLSSVGKKKGAEAGNPLPVHVALPISILEKAKPGQLVKSKKAWVTEGPIKADIASEIVREPFIGIPGLTAWRQCITTLINMEVEHVILCFDMDIARKELLRDQIILFKEKLFEIPQIKRVDVALWNEEKHGKGIDDMLINSYFPDIRILFSKESVV